MEEAETATLFWAWFINFSNTNGEAASILFINNKAFVPTIKKVKNVNEINKLNNFKKTNNILKNICTKIQ